MSDQELDRKIRRLRADWSLHRHGRLWEICEWRDDAGYVSVAAASTISEVVDLALLEMPSRSVQLRLVSGGR